MLTPPKPCGPGASHAEEWISLLAKLFRETSLRWWQEIKRIAGIRWGTGVHCWLSVRSTWDALGGGKRLKGNEANHTTLCVSSTNAFPLALEVFTINYCLFVIFSFHPSPLIPSANKKSSDLSTLKKEQKVFHLDGPQAALLLLLLGATIWESIVLTCSLCFLITTYSQNPCDLVYTPLLLDAWIPQEQQQYCYNYYYRKSLMEEESRFFFAAE